MNKFCFTFIANFADFLAMVDYMVHFSAVFCGTALVRRVYC